MIYQSDWHARKAARKEYYERFVKGWKMKPCVACAGSGYYDDGSGHPCSSCDGTGKFPSPPDRKVV